MYYLLTFFILDIVYYAWNVFNLSFFFQKTKSKSRTVILIEISNSIVDYNWNNWIFKRQQNDFSHYFVVQKYYSHRLETFQHNIIPYIVFIHNKFKKIF